MQRFLKKLLWYSFMLWLLNMGLGYYLSTYESQDLVEAKQFYPVLRWADYYEEKEPIDVLVLGSSHAYRSYDPAVIETELQGKRVFNFGSSGQSPENGFFVLNEVLQKHQPTYLIFDIYYMVFTKGSQIRNRRFNWQEMKKGKPKKDFFWQGFSIQEKINLILFPAYIYKKYLKSKFNKILSRSYLPLSDGVYQGSGFVATPDTLSLEELKNGNQFDVFKTRIDELTDLQINYLKKIKNLCAKENIQLLLTASPMPVISVEKIGNYEDFSTVFKRLSREWEIPFVDYNIDRIPEIKDEFHYYDDDHLNAAGAAIFSEAIARELKKNKK